MERNPKEPITFVIFGGTGDLTRRKLLPAFYNLEYDQLLRENLNIVAIGRKEYSDESYRQESKEFVQEFTKSRFDNSVWNRLKDKIRYFRFNFSEEKTFCLLSAYLKALDNNQSRRIYYLAVAPEFFAPIAEKLHHDCLKQETYPPRVVIEKPFGRDLTSARFLNEKIVSAFSEENTYRIDHYLGKEMLQSIMVIRFSNSIFEPIWNRHHIEQVQILSSETLGIGTRGEYYEQSGAIRDMLQSHLLQLLSLIAMEEPKSLDNQAIRDEKVKVLKHLQPYRVEDVKEFVVRGQYGEGENMVSYRNEQNVKNDSVTETYVALKMFVDNERWKGVPFYIRTGKRLPKKTTEIIIEFKQKPNLYQDISPEPNYLVFKIQPEEGVNFQFNAKRPGSNDSIIPVNMDFCQNCQIGYNSPEAYERLLFDVMRGDATLFARWDEVEYAWRFVDSIIQAWNQEVPDFPNYQAGSWGPKEADRLMEKDKRKWLIFGGKKHADL